MFNNFPHGNTSWLYRQLRLMIGAIAIFGAINTGYLTVAKLVNSETICPTNGCERVLASGYATLFGLPLSLLGLLAYASIVLFAFAPLAIKLKGNKQLHLKLEKLTWLLLFAGATAMAGFSTYLMYIMVSKFVIPLGIKGICYYCIASAIFALSLSLLTFMGCSWINRKQLLLMCTIILIATLLASHTVYAPARKYSKLALDNFEQAITTISSTAEIELAGHLKNVGAEMYGAYWCNHCQEQKALFGKEAFQKVPYIECAAEGKNSHPDRCVAAKIEGFPTWKIQGQKYPGIKSLEELAQISSYAGPRNFKNQ
jgi:uncharacterized membrane protein